MPPSVKRVRARWRSAATFSLGEIERIGCDENHLAVYPAVINEAHQHHPGDDAGIYQIHRGTKHAAAHALHTILTGNDDRVRTMHTVAARTERKLLSAIVAALLERNDQRRGDRAQAWRTHSAQTRAAKPHSNASPSPDSRLLSASGAATKGMDSNSGSAKTPMSQQHRFADSWVITGAGRPCLVS